MYSYACKLVIQVMLTLLYGEGKCCVLVTIIHEQSEVKTMITLHEKPKCGIQYGVNKLTFTVNIAHKNTSFRVYCYNVTPAKLFCSNTISIRGGGGGGYLFVVFITGVLHCPTLSISRCSWIFLAQGKFSKM